MRTIVLTSDEDGYFAAYFSDNPEARVSGYETKAEAVGALILRYGEVLNIQINEV